MLYLFIYLFIHLTSLFIYLSSKQIETVPHRVQTSQVFIRDCTSVPPIAVLLFGGDISIQHMDKTVTMDSWLQVKSVAKTAVIIKELRKKLLTETLSVIKTPTQTALTDEMIALTIEALVAAP